jgi:NAD-dependent DNA ligase
MCVDGKAFVFTGELNNVPRDDAEARVKACGGVIRSAVSGKTNYLVVGERLEDGRDVKCTSKYTKAQAIMAGPNKSNLRILNKSEFFELTKE